METQSIYQETIKFAGNKHAEMNQLVPGTRLPYVVHLSNVAMEVFIAFQNSTDEKFDLNLALQLALLHDTIEDTHTTFEEIEHLFGNNVANGVAALTKNDLLPKDKKMDDSLNRIKALQKEVWMVKLADRITNLQKPPQHWTKEKKQNYKNEAVEILTKLEGGNSYLELRLKNQIISFEQYIHE